MKLNQEPGPEMRALIKAVQEAIDTTVQSSVDALKNGVGDEAPTSEKRAYNVLHEALMTPEQVASFQGVIKNACLSVFHSFFTSLDEGVEGPGDKPLKLDIVGKEDRESIITWSAQEEFWYCVPDGYVPFDYD